MSFLLLLSFYLSFNISGFVLYYYYCYLSCACTVSIMSSGFPDLRLETPYAEYLNTYPQQKQSLHQGACGQAF